MSEQATEKKIPLWLAISALIIVAGCLFTIVVLILYQMDYQRRAETARLTAAQIYEDAVIPEGVVLLHQEQIYNPKMLSYGLIQIQTKQSTSITKKKTKLNPFKQLKSWFVFYFLCVEFFYSS